MTRKFICVVGIDGSGKTTLARGLAADLGPKARYLYLRYQPWVMRPVLWLAARTVLSGRSFEKDYGSYQERKRDLSARHGVLARVYRALLLSDYLLQLTWKLAPAKLMGRTIVADRYLHDTVATDLAVDFNLSEEDCERMLKRFYRVFPKPQVVVYLDVHPHVAMARKTDVPDVAYLVLRKRFYDHLARSFDWRTLDASQDPVSVRMQAHLILREVSL